MDNEEQAIIDPAVKMIYYLMLVHKGWKAMDRPTWNLYAGLLDEFMIEDETKPYHIWPTGFVKWVVDNKMGVRQ